MTPKPARVGGFLGLYLDFCVLVGALWVGLARRRMSGSDRRHDLEALVGGMMIFGATLALWFAAEKPLIDIGPVGDGVEGFTLGVLLGFVVTGLFLAIRVWTEMTSD